MTALQILDRLAFCIGYAVIGGVVLSLVILVFIGCCDAVGEIIVGGLKHDSEKRKP